MNQGKEASLHDGKNRHGLGKTVDRCTPRLLKQQQNGGNQRAGVADTDPPNKINDGEAPSDRDGHAPNTHAFDKQIADRSLQHTKKSHGNGNDQYPEDRGVLSEHYPGKAVRNGAEGLARADDRRPYTLGGRMSGAAISYVFSVPDASLGLGFRTAAT